MMPFVSRSFYFMQPIVGGIIWMERAKLDVKGASAAVGECA